MQSETITSSETKQITIDVPAARLAEFYAFFGRFLSAEAGRGRRGRHAGGPGHRGHHCGGHRGPTPGGETPAVAGPPTGTTNV